MKDWTTTLFASVKVGVDISSSHCPKTPVWHEFLGPYNFSCNVMRWVHSAAAEFISFLSINRTNAVAVVLYVLLYWMIACILASPTISMVVTI